MPRVYDVDDVVTTDGRSCGAIRDDLRDCILNDDCVKKDKKLPSECFRLNLISEECASMRTLLFECKRSLVRLSSSSLSCSSSSTGQHDDNIMSLMMMKSLLT